MKRAIKASVPNPEVPASATPAEPGPDPRQALLQTVRALTMVMDGGDPFTRGRTLRISRYSVRLARELGASPSELLGIELGALLHDLGRTALLNDVVTSPRALDAGERAIVQTHPTIGYDMLKDIPGLEEAAEIVWKHHERPDGKGYPRALGPERIPLGARVVMVCAAYDAMTEDRPYRRGLSPRAACDELRLHAGSQFFADVVECFVKLHDNGKLWEHFSKEEIELYVRRGDLAAA